MNKYHEKDGLMAKLQNEIAQFIEQRDWRQYHAPKKLARAFSGEVAELVEIFQWMTAEEIENVAGVTLAHLEEEIGDVMIYLTTLAACFDLDPVTAARKKLLLNAEKYPLTGECQQKQT